MDADEKLCRLCLQTCEGGFEIVQEATKETLNVILLMLDLSVADEPVLCNSCGDSLKKCFDFKMNCMQRKQQEGEGSIKMNEPPVSLCYFCKKLVEDGQFLSLENKDISMMLLLEQYFPEVVLNLPEESISCTDCHQSLQNHLTFINRCLSVEQQIRKYCEIEGTNSKGQVELSKVLKFTSKSELQNTVPMHSANTNKVNAVKIEEPCYEQIESENSKVKLEREDLVSIEKQALDIKGDYSNTELEDEGIDSFQMEEHPSEPVTNINLAVRDDSDQNKSEKQIAIHKCHTCAFQTKYKESLKRHMVGHIVPTEITMNKCHLCTFQTRHMGNLQSHMLIHNQSPETAMYKCQFCPYETKHKRYLQGHMLVHQQPSEVPLHKCQLCPFETKNKRDLQSHMLVHKEPAEVTMYKCELCSYQTSRKHCLPSHMLTHKKPVETLAHKCKSCSFQTKYKSNFKKHLLIHKKPSEITMYKCHLCAYQSMHKGNLNTHMLVHKKPSETALYKCQTCSFETKRKINLRKHMATHKEDDSD